MTTQTPKPAADTGLPEIVKLCEDANAATRDRLLDAIDELARARDLVELIKMTTNFKPERETRAIEAGCAAALERLGTSREQLYAALGQAAPEENE